MNDKGTYDETDQRNAAFVAVGGFFLAIAFIWGLTGFARRSVESRVHAAISKSLEKAGLGHIKVETNGQRASLKAYVNPAEASRALRIARRAKANTWAGAFLAPTQVRVSFDDNKSSKRREVSFVEVEAKLTDLQLSLQGSVPSETIKKQLLLQAQESLEGTASREVVDRLRVLGGSDSNANMELADRMISALALCKRGSASVKTGLLNFDCEAESRQIATVERNLSEPMRYGALGEVKVYVKAGSEASCAKRLMELSESTVIEFPSGRSILTKSSRARLDDFAEQTRGCLTHLLIEGHTDSVGSPSYNQKLSEQRAEAVAGALAKRGIARSAMQIKGHGESRPRHSKAPSTARQNRRVTLHAHGKNQNN